jgi:hypothetical protein
VGWYYRWVPFGKVPALMSLMRGAKATWFANFGMEGFECSALTYSSSANLTTWLLSSFRRGHAYWQF